MQFWRIWRYIFVLRVILLRYYELVVFLSQFDCAFLQIFGISEMNTNKLPIQIARNLKFFILLTSLVYVCHCFDLKPMHCTRNLSLTESCSSSLYFVPDKPKTLEETALLFRLNFSAISRTIDGFLIAVQCSCPAGHDEFGSHLDYTVQPGDSWETVSSKFGSFVLEKPKKGLIVSQTIRLDLLCGCSGKVPLISYKVEPGDTLYTVCSRFGANVKQTADLNGIDNPALIHVGDILFIPAQGTSSLILPGNEDSKVRKSHHRLHILLGALAGAVAFVLLSSASLLWILLLKRKEIEQPSSTSRGAKYLLTLFLSDTKPKQNDLPLFSSDKSTIFAYREICDATASFSASQKIGQGSYGSVYIGHLRGSEVAIKQMKNTKSKEFLAEVNILCRVHHTNLIELIGYAAGGDSLFLVYEFAENGALSDHLHNHTSKGYAPLSWIERVQIALDAAKGLEYIHAYTKAYYVHRDVKTSNILLDSNKRAKIADFGLVKLLEHSPEVGAATSKVVGTFGYLAPEYVRDGCVTTKSDVYSFGVVLMELLTGQPALSRNPSTEGDQCFEHHSVVDLILSALKDEHNSLLELTKCIDPKLIHYHMDSLFQMAQLSKDCVDDDWKRRPDMCKVVLRLSYILACTMQGGSKDLDHPFF